MNIDYSLLDRIREHSTELENHHIDELVAGRLSRRDFLRRGGVIGMSASVMGGLLAACGGANSSGSSASTGAASRTPTKGGTVRVAVQAPASDVNPLTLSSDGDLEMLYQVGDYLVNDNTGRPGPPLQPMLATSWKPNHDATVWTFKLRPNVKFHNGQAMSADDVVYTMQQQCNPKNASNALSVFGGIVVPAGVRKVDDLTVAFHLEQPIGSFPYLVSPDNYNCIIVPKGTDFAKFQQAMIATGAFKLKSYTQNVGANFVANPSYWGGPPHLDATAFAFFQSQAPQILALQGGSVDVVALFAAQGAEALLSDSQYKVLKLETSIHRELSMRCDRPPFSDPRVRQAVALTLDRPGLVKALLHGYGSVGNDSPFAPIFASTDSSVPQRTQNIAKARQLLAAAGHPNGIAATMFTEEFQEVPGLAQAIAASAKQAGISINLKVENQASYYGKSTYGNSDWLDGEMSLVDYGDRGVPNVVLESALTSGGPWNAAHFRNNTYDALVKQYVATIDLQTQRSIAGKIETLLLDQTPIIIPYWIDDLTATTSAVKGVVATSSAAVSLKDASKVAG
ncbi:MAG: ABC transporter substrate-binding protein [Solirubrobacteraceae bacterium]